jgi:membrane associated rhomboid family serine protease
MFPLRDHQPTYKLPLITYVIIAVNVVVFLIEMVTADQDAFIYTFALVPELVDFSKIGSLYPFITSQFLHAGFFHILSNMWFLKIFGDNVEEKFNHVLYLLVYILSGIVGGLAQYIFSPNSDIPMLGASGAVAGVLGAYLVFFPRHRIETLIPFGVFTRIIQVPAFIMLVYWLITQIFSGIGSIAYASVGGVAWFAHIGGFVTGWIVAKFFSGEIIEVVETGEVLD